MIEVTFKFPSFEAAKEFFSVVDSGRMASNTYAGQRPSAVVLEPEAVPAVVVTELARGATGPSATAEPVPAKPKRGRPRKDKAVSETPDEPATAPAVASTGTAPSLDDVRVALKSLNAAKGIELCRQVFAEFKVPRPNVNDLKAESYGAFVKRCNELAA